MLMLTDVNSNRYLWLCWLFVIMTLPTLWAGMANDSTLTNEIVVKCIHISSYTLLLINFIIILFYKCYAIKKNTVITMMSIVSYWFFYYFNQYKVQNPAILNFAFLLMFVIIADELKAKIYIITKQMLMFVAVMGILAYIFTILNINVGQVMVAYYSGEGAQAYISFGGAYLFVEGMFLRLCGIFNEPGYFGTVIALVLVIEKYRINKINVILFVAGVLSWSMAFFVISMLSILFFYRHKMLKIVFCGMLIGIFVGYVGIDNENASHLLTRFTIDEQGNFIGNNRSNKNIDECFEATVTSDYLLMGHGTGYAGSISNRGIGTYKSLIIDQGIMGTMCAYGLLFFAAIISAKKVDDRWFVLCFILSVYQRPNIFIIIYFILLFGGLAHMHIRGKGRCI